MNKRLSVWAAVAVACLMSPAAWCANYFVDSVAGNDGNSGLAESAAWKSIAKVNGSGFPFGSTVYLKRGSVWREQLTVPSSGLTIDAYGAGALPTLDSSTPVTGWQWEGNGIFSRAVTLLPLGFWGGFGNITQNGVMMSHASWNGSAYGSLNAAPSNSFTFNFYENKLYIKPATDPAGNAYLASTVQHGILADGKTDINVQNVNVTRPSLHGISFNNCDRCSVRSSTISDGGGGVVYQHSNPYLYAGNGVEHSGRSEGGVVDGVTIKNMFDSGVAPQTFAPHSRVSGITFQNLTIERCGLAGVEMSVLPGSGPSTLSNITVNYVTILDTGRGWSGNRYGNSGHGVGVSVHPGSGSMSGITIRGVYIINSVGDGISFNGEVGTMTLDRLLIAGNRYGVNASNHHGQAHSMFMVLTNALIFYNRSYGVTYNSPSSQGFYMFHNTFYDNTGINFGVYGQNGTAYILNNIFASSNPAMRQLYVDNPAGLAGGFLDYNCYTTGPNMIRYRNVEYGSLPPLAAATFFESHGAAASNLLFNNAGGFDFGLQASSPCAGRGVPLGIPTDLFGMPFKNPRSMGAIERP